MLPRRAGAGSASVSVADVLEAVLSLHGERLAQVLAASGFLLDGIAVRDRNTEVGEGAQLDVLPPFAGG
ncbi:ThiS family protein [Halopolyspora algeriensis]|uniref:ThiS family protein n=1 Tax=Halopolyspora algeriensis TaxID=1500506 RepID=A0A368VQ27_9ACTN|nr:ThiS family protein [Halopolyspora algeriensis]TQM47617.1 ThiS family protein [Halopolyspora algeriensis]